MPAVAAERPGTEPNGLRPRLSYGSMRLRWCGLALRASAQRWGVYMVVTAAVVGAGSNSPVQAVATALALPSLMLGAAARLPVPLT